MSKIEKALDSLEKAVAKERELAAKEAKAVKKLQNPVRSGQLAGFLEAAAG